MKLGELLQQAVAPGEISLELSEPATLADVLAQLHIRFPELARELPPGGKTRSGLPYHFFVNRRLVPETTLASHPLKDGDVVHILSPAAGG
ncbi:MAG: MoaD/ThiS family protein [Anaerolineae bacterium]|nr:MoaD/ThiS family protein [Anaerolineae bacterium]MDW8071253.1 MoaD/ThiS family protein [Anaerolineae bacterium]